MRWTFTSTGRIGECSGVPHTNRDWLAKGCPTFSGERRVNNVHRELFGLLNVFTVFRTRPLPKIIFVLVTIWKLVVAAWVIRKSSPNDVGYGIEVSLSGCAHR